MTEARDGFLSRWARLKREAVTAPAADAAVATPAPPEGQALQDLIAELPGVEDLVPGQSLAAFMQPWVPTAIRNAALQRMWLLDPAISGYVDPALDYAYDYNTLGAAPGFGPMEASRDAVQEVASMFDRALGRTGPAEDGGPDCTCTADDPEEPAVPAAKSLAAKPPAPPARLPTPASQADIASHNKASDPNDLRPAVRRHGRALPG